jgi:putative ABC transport system substrate-binding protein
VATTPDLIIAIPGATAAVAVLRETHTIPIVFLLSFDPVAEGLVANFAHPGGNATGFFLFGPSSGKWLQLLKETAPHVARAMCLFGPNWTSSTSALSQYYSEFWEAVDQSARSIGVTVAHAVARDDEEIETTLAEFSQQPHGGLIIAPDSFNAAHRAQIIASTARLRVPAVYPIRFYAADGGLLSYGGDIPDLFRQSADYVGRILRGAKPADLPAQGPRKFELVVNLKTAKALGLTIPPSIIARADEVIE